MNHATIEAPVDPGQRGKRVRAVQEWLCLSGYAVAIDGTYGSATGSAVAAFQQAKGLPASGAVDQQTANALVQPLIRAAALAGGNGRGLRSMILHYALQHLREHPREVGGQNCGPWVRLYTRGREGSEWPWCAGFVSYLIWQACESLQVKVPLPWSVSCDFIAASAQERGMFVTEKQAGDRSRLPPGSLFLTRRTSTDWTHVGVVVAADADVFETIEGNTNDAGDREGYEVCRRRRGYGSKDFIVL